MYNLEREVKKRLDALGWTIEKLAEKMEVSKVTIHRAFKTNDAKLSLLAQMAKLFNEPVTALLEDNEDLINRPVSKSDLCLKAQNRLWQDKFQLQRQLLESKDEQIQLLKRELSRHEGGKKDGRRKA